MIFVNNRYFNDRQLINMKKILFILIALLTSINLMAQEHLSFKGIPIEGSMSSFCQKLKEKGFISIRRDNNLTLFSGDFTGRKATVGVVATDNEKNVFAIAVFFEPSKEWETLVDTYDYYKDLYTRKYGTSSISRENNPEQGGSNTSLMYELYQGKVTYASAWKATGGTIELSIEKADAYLSGIVVIRYRDAQNIETKIKKDLEDI